MDGPVDMLGTMHFHKYQYKKNNHLQVVACARFARTTTCVC